MRYLLLLAVMAGSLVAHSARAQDAPPGTTSLIAAAIEAGDEIRLGTILNGSIVQPIAGTLDIRAGSPGAIVAKVRGCTRRLLRNSSSGVSNFNGIVWYVCEGRVSDRRACDDIGYALTMNDQSATVSASFMRLDDWSVARCGARPRSDPLPWNLRVPKVPSGLPPPSPGMSVTPLAPPPPALPPAASFVITQATANALAVKIKALLAAAKSGDQVAFGRLAVPGTLLKIGGKDGRSVPLSTASLIASFGSCERDGKMIANDDYVEVPMKCDAVGRWPRSILVYFAGTSIIGITVTSTDP